jgi:hypothetical protein
MSTLLTVLGWFCIGSGAFYSADKLVRLARGRRAGSRLGGQAATLREAWPGLRPFVLAIAVGLALLTDQGKRDATTWWLGNLRLLVLATLLLASWIRSRIRRPG